MKCVGPRFEYEPFNRARFELMTWGEAEGYDDRVGVSLSRGHDGADPLWDFSFEVVDPPRWLRWLGARINRRHDKLRDRRWRGWTRRHKKRDARNERRRSHSTHG